MKLSSFLIFMALGLSLQSWAQDPIQDESALEKDFEPPSTARTITLKEILEQGLRENPWERQRQFDRELLQLGWKDTYESFWFPNINLVAQSYNGQRMDKWYSGNTGETRPFPRTPTGFIGVEFGNYNVFNWGRDYLDYLSARETFKRKRTRLNEQRRELKHDLIIAFFELRLKKRLVDIAREQLRQTSFFYRLGREKANSKKISKQEYYQARSEYLRAQREYQDAKLEAKLADENFAFFIGDDLMTSYVVRDTLVTRKMRLELEMAEKLALSNAPPVLTAEATMKNSQRGYEKSIKDNLPLPTLSVNLGTYGTQIDKNTGDDNFRTAQDSKNIELVATLNATWNILGEGGLFNKRRVRGSLVDKMKAERVYRDTKNLNRSRIRQLYRNILNLERQLEINEARVKTAVQSYETHLNNYVRNRNRFVDLKVALEIQKQSKDELAKVRFEHLKNKVNLARTIGIEDFPGENFEDLARTEIAQ